MSLSTGIDPASLPVHHPVSLHALLSLGAEENTARRLAAQFPSWRHLVLAPAQSLLAAAGPPATHLTLTARPTSVLPFAADPHVGTIVTEPLLWWSRGQVPLPQRLPALLPPRRRDPIVLGITGAAHPSASGLAVAVAAVFVAGQHGASIVMDAHADLAHVVVRACEMFRVPLVWVCPDDPEMSAWQRGSARSMTSSGGGVCWVERSAGMAPSDQAGRLFAHLSPVILTVDAEPYEDGGYPGISAALRLGRPLLMHASPSRPLAGALSDLLHADLHQGHTLAGLGLRTPGRDVISAPRPVIASPAQQVTWSQVPQRVCFAMRSHTASCAV